MSRPLQHSRPGETLREVLLRMGPAAMRPYLKETPGYRLIFQQSGAAANLAADVSIELSHEHGVAVQTVTLTNEGSEPSPPIREMDAFFLPLTVAVRDRPRACGFGGGLTDGFYPPRAYREEEVSFGKARTWIPAERRFSRWWCGKGVFSLSSGPTGRSSNPNLPIMQVGWKTADGEVGLWAAMEWSGRWHLVMGSGEDWRFVFRGGPTVKGLVLGPGERLHLPRTHVGVYGGPGCDSEDGFNRIRRYIADIHAPDVEGKRPHPLVAYDHWFGIHENVSDSLLRRQAERAAELGCEYFVIDAGWYGGSTENFADGVGNWERVDERKFPDGLEAISEYVRSKGLRFGLWFEPERARAGSDWLTEHPEWYWQADSPANFALDLTQRAVQDGLIEMLSGWTERLDIRWLRWDNNQAPGPFWDRIDPTGKVQFAYVAGLYRVLDTLLERHPNLMIDNCAGGGQRVDFGTLRRAGTMVISDHAEDPHVCRIMQTGGARVLPGNYMNSSIYVAERDGDDAVGPLELVSRMAGSVTLNGHIANWSGRRTKRVRKYLDGYRTFRHLLMRDFHRLTPYPRSDADWDVVQFLDPETREAVVLAYRVRGDETTRKVTPKRLDPGCTYAVIDPFSTRKPRVVTGGRLLEKGLRLTLQPESAAVRHLKPVD